MRVLVGIKHVPDTETKIRIGADGASIDPTGVKWTISPYDEFALEAALRLRESGLASDVLVVSAGPVAAEASLRQALAIGADRGILVEDPRYEHADAVARARALAAVARAEGVGLALLGRYGVGADEGLTGPMLGELLDWPHVSGVVKLELDGAGFSARRPVEGAIEIHEGRLPAVVSCDKGLNEPRFASLKGIMAAKKKPLERRTPAELGLETHELGAGRRVVWERLELPAPRAAGRLLGGSAEQAAAELVRLLRDEAKVL